MKDMKLPAALALLCAVLCVKLLLPDLSADLRQEIREALSPAGESLTVFSPRETEAPAVPEHSPSPPEAAPVLYRIEEAVNLGEADPEEEQPEAVTVFLESQLPFQDYPLPESVDYGYYPLPFDCAVPVAGYQSSGFGYRLHPIQNVVKFHYGTDVAAFSGEDIYAFAAGTVSFAGPSDSYGNYIILDHGDGWTTLYAHCSYLYVQAGQTVEAGEKIALVGATGHVTGPHLHLELRHNGVYLNPEYYING